MTCRRLVVMRDARVTGTWLGLFTVSHRDRSPNSPAQLSPNHQPAPYASPLGFPSSIE